MAAEYGFIYVLGNESMPGIYKIGFTTRHPKARAAEISRATGCPELFVIVAYFGVEQPEHVEGEIHALFSRQRVNSSREFFRITLAQIGEVVGLYGDEHSDAVYRRQLDNLIALEDYERSTG